MRIISKLKWVKAKGTQREILSFSIVLEKNKRMEPLQK